MKMIIGCLVLGVYLSYFGFVFLIPFLKEKKLGQSIRIDGPKEHLKKAGTPTLGGSLVVLIGFFTYFLISIALKRPLLTYNNLLLWVTILGYFVIGFIDDYRNIHFHNNEGIKPLTKIIMQIFVGLLSYLFYHLSGYNNEIILFGKSINIFFIYGVWLVLVIMATSNAVNITDGIDGLASGLVFIAFAAFAIIAYKNDNSDITLLLVSFMVSLISFMIFNLHPAKIFMGNTGSMSFGAILAITALILKKELILLLIGLPFVIETLSVIIQVTYFKLTKGKRVFPMAPLHHTFEYYGMNEWQIDLLFWSVGLLCGILGVALNGIL